VGLDPACGQSKLIVFIKMGSFGQNNTEVHLLTASVAIKSVWLLNPKKSGISEAWNAPSIAASKTFRYPCVLCERRTMIGGLDRLL